MIVIFRLYAHITTRDMIEGVDITCQSSRCRSCRSCASRLHVLLLVNFCPRSLVYSPSPRPSQVPPRTLTSITKQSQTSHHNKKQEQRLSALRPSNIDWFAILLSNMASTSNPQHPTSLEVKATHKNSDISASNTPTENDLLVVQGLTALEVNQHTH
jgi:hypothetical protein